MWIICFLKVIWNTPCHLHKCLCTLMHGYFIFLFSCMGTEARQDENSAAISSVVLYDIDSDSTNRSNTNCKFSWTSTYSINNSLEKRIKPPSGFYRTKAEENSFGDWLRNLPLKEGRGEVYLFNGSLKRTQEVHYAVVDIDIGEKDLQQCADAVMRLRGEYLYSINNYKDLHFNFTSGDNIEFEKWKEGFRPLVKGNTVSLVRQASPDSSYKSFRKYMDNIFMYAGTASLSKELNSVKFADMQIGDVFIIGGFPGHAVIVVDVAINDKGQKLFLLAQSYMPAQNIHVLNNLNNKKLSPWYELFEEDDLLMTPEWNFKTSDLKRFKK